VSKPSRSLDWIPRRLKENVKLVLSVSDEDLLDALKRDVVCAALNYVQVCTECCLGNNADLLYSGQPPHTHIHDKNPLLAKLELCNDKQEI